MPVLRQKGEYRNGCYKETKHTEFSKNEYFLHPDTGMHTCVLRGKKCSFFGKFGGLCVLVTHVLRFALLPYYRRIQ